MTEKEIIAKRYLSIAGASSLTGVTPTLNIPQKVAPEKWPMWAKALKLLAKPEDKGIGDVIRRTIGEENSDAFKKWYKSVTGKNCGCSGRQEYWNRIYPL